MSALFLTFKFLKKTKMKKLTRKISAFTALLLLSCVNNYEKPFEQSIQVESCESESAASLEQRAARALLAQAKVACLNNDFKYVSLIENTNECASFVRPHKYCSDASNEAFTRCKAFFKCSIRVDE